MTAGPPMTDLPVRDALPAVREALDSARAAVLRAPPGAGKTTLVPPALLDAAWLADKTIMMIEPRRLAARAAAYRIAELLGEPVGKRAGYRVRLDSRVGPETRIEVVTPGIYLRRLQGDPALDGVGLVIFDEIHERGVELDLALALTLEARAALAPDLRLLAMSATVAATDVAALLGDCPVIDSEGRSFPVDIRYWEREPEGRPAELALLGMRRAIAESEGDMLVFLPGVGDIRRAEELASEAALPVRVDTLYGDMPLAGQARVLSSGNDPKGRRAVLATSIAETSLTIEGIGAVVDTGYTRAPRFDPASGMSRLETVRISRAAADQRAGRAGRLGPGVAYRLWTEAAQRGLAPFTAPEIANADLAPLALELACWGAAAEDLCWHDAPPAGALAQARDLLRALGALDGEGRVTSHGRAMAEAGTHPRLAHMLIKGRDAGQGPLAALLAALLSERDPLRAGRGGGERPAADMSARLSFVLRDKGGLAARIRRQAEVWAKDGGGLAALDRASFDDGRAARLLALAYPDRVAMATGGGRFRLASGRGAVLDAHDPLARAPFLAIADMDAGGGRKGDGTVYRAAALDEADVRTLFADRIGTAERTEWDARAEEAVSVREERLGALILSSRPLGREADPTPAVLDGIRQLGLGALPWERETEALRARLAFLYRTFPDDGWPDVSDEALLDRLEDWLAPFLAGIRRRAQFASIDLKAALSGLVPWDKRQEMDRLAPTALPVPSGREARLDYTPDAPVLSVKLQEMFGQTATPTIAGGRVPVVVHLLSPAGRPLAVTRDLANFWAEVYPQVRAEMRGRYPKHPWPDDPLQAPATAKTKKRMGG